MNEKHRLKMLREMGWDGTVEEYNKEMIAADHHFKTFPAEPLDVDDYDCHEETRHKLDELRKEHKQLEELASDLLFFMYMAGDKLHITHPTINILAAHRDTVNKLTDPTDWSNTYKEYVKGKTQPTPGENCNRPDGCAINHGFSMCTFCGAGIPERSEG